MFKCKFTYWKAKNTQQEMTGNTGISTFQHLRFRKCSQSRNHAFFGMIQFHFFWAHSFFSDDHQWAR